MKRNTILGLVLCLFLVGGVGCDEEDHKKLDQLQADKKLQKAPEEFRIEGKLRMVGSAPFYEFILTTDSQKDYYLQFNNRIKASDYMAYQTKRIKVVGTLFTRTLKTPDGKYSVNKNIISVTQLTVLE